MRYNVTHVTRYTYGATVELTTGVLRLKPVSRDGQVLERFSLKTDPPCLPPTERIDAFGNAVLSLRIESPHRELTVEAASRVRIDRPDVLELSAPWETVAAEALIVPSLVSDSPAIGTLSVPRPVAFRRGDRLRPRKLPPSAADPRGGHGPGAPHPRRLPLRS